MINREQEYIISDREDGEISENEEEKENNKRQRLESICCNPEHLRRGYRLHWESTPGT